MPNINLIAPRRAEKKRLERNTQRLFAGLIAEVALLAAMGSFLAARQMALRGALSDAEAQIVKLQPTLDRIAQIEADTSALTPKLDTLAAAKQDTLRWRALLQIVSQAVPGNAWLGGITSSATGEDTTITLTGTAGSQTLVGETMTRLGAFPVFDKVELRFTQLLTTSNDPTPRVSFEIGAHLKSTDPPADSKAAEGKTAQGEADGKSDA